MSNGPPSCLVAKIGHYIELDDAERAMIVALEKDERVYRKGVTVRSEGDPVRDLFVVKQGWLLLHSTLDSGDRQVYDLHFPGDIVGTRDVVFDRATVTMTAASELVLCPFPKYALDQVFIRSPRISALLFAFGVLETTTVFDRLRAIARMDATRRLGFFLLQVISRLRIGCPGEIAELEMPLSQELIGDVLGLSQVHVNRTMKELEREGLIRRGERGTIAVDVDRLSELTEFSDRYYRIDTSWFPRAS